MHSLLPHQQLAMVELVAVVAVALVAAAIALFSVILAKTMKPSPAAERERLEQYLAWLEDRRRHAEAHDYDADMKAHIANELARAQAEYAALRRETVLVAA